MRLSQSFKSPANSKTKEAFTQIWHKNQMQNTLTNWPVGETINWSKVASEHGISAKNGGQKENGTTLGNRKECMQRS